MGMGPIGQTTTVSEHGHVAYPIKGNHEMQQHDSNYFARRTLPDPGVNRSKLNFFRTSSCCGCNYFVVRHLLDPAVGVKRSKLDFFLNMVMLNIKLKGITKCSSMVANIMPADPSLTLGMGSIGQN